jgi:hypothetical protein
MKQFTNRYVIMISNTQLESIIKLKEYNVNIGNFIRSAIKEKIQRDWKNIKESKSKIKCPF